jgi:hypothetical protein
MQAQHKMPDQIEPTFYSKPQPFACPSFRFTRYLGRSLVNIPLRPLPYTVTGGYLVEIKERFLSEQNCQAQRITRALFGQRMAS